MGKVQLWMTHPSKHVHSITQGWNYIHNQKNSEHPYKVLRSSRSSFLTRTGGRVGRWWQRKSMRLCSWYSLLRGPVGRSCSGLPPLSYGTYCLCKQTDPRASGLMGTRLTPQPRPSKLPSFCTHRHHELQLRDAVQLSQKDLKLFPLSFPT